MTAPDDLYYTRDHLWLRVEGEIATIGITDHAQEEMNDIVFVELPDLGDIEKDSPVVVIESVLTERDIYTPISGEIVEGNIDLAADPMRVNTDPYDSGWIFRMRVSHPNQVEDLMDAASYVSMISYG